MEMFYYVVLFVLLIFGIQCEQHLHAHGPFGKPHLTVDIPNPTNCNRTIGLLSHIHRSKSVKITELQVSTTNYTNTETLHVSWTPTFTPCKDDFIGVYFVEIPDVTGRQSNCFSKKKFYLCSH